MAEGDRRKSSESTPSVGSLRSTPCRTADRRVAGGCWARPPFRARQSGVRIAWTITASRGCGGDDDVFAMLRRFVIFEPISLRKSTIWASSG